MVKDVKIYFIGLKKDLFGCFRIEEIRNKDDRTGLVEGGGIEMSTTVLFIYAMHRSPSLKILTCNQTSAHSTKACKRCWYKNATQRDDVAGRDRPSQFTSSDDGQWSGNVSNGYLIGQFLNFNFLKFYKFTTSSLFKKSKIDERIEQM